MVNVYFDLCIMKYLKYIQIITKILNNIFNLIIASFKLYVLWYLLFTASTMRNTIVNKNDRNIMIKKELCVIYDNKHKEEVDLNKKRVFDILKEFYC